MERLTVWRFETPGGAEQAAATLQELSEKNLLRLHDAAVVSWDTGAKRPKTRQLHNLAGAGALGGAFWGLLFGMIFFMPLLGMAVGAAAGAMGGSMRNVGIDDNFIKRTRDEITPGTSALFVLSSAEVLDKVRDAFAGQQPELVFTNMSDEQEKVLLDAFAG
nr:DUF1269 domain-containing protein [uncultured Actinoplanes sp.]